MDLFVINRYTGNKPNKQETPNEELLKEKLLKKIEERKRLSELSIENENKIKRKKIKKYESDHPTENNVLEQTENVERERKRRKPEGFIECIKLENAFLSESPNGTELFDRISGENENQIIDDEITDQNTIKHQKLDIKKPETGFTILGDAYVSKKEKIKRKLPNWLANPSVVPVDLKNLTSSIDSIQNLDEIFVSKLKENGITHFFPVQSQIIPWLLENTERPRMYWPNDICVSAPTGSGKTLAFVLPILQILHKRVVPKIRALVVLPVQDLANQVFSVFKTYSKSTNLNVLLLTKKCSFKEEQSLICKSDGMGNYRTMIDIIVTTPGRLVDHLTKTEGLYLGDLTHLIIDEADRVMESVQNDWLYHLNKHINSECIKSYQNPIISYNNMSSKRRPPQKLLFSATLSQDPEKLQQLGLFQPKLFTSVVKSTNVNENGPKDETKFLGKFTTPAELTEYYIKATKANKPLILHHFLRSGVWKKVLCFVDSAEATTRLAFVLKTISGRKIKIGKLSSNLTVKKRNAVLKKFSSDKINVLISSDALARGIDIPDVQFVISYDAPKFIKTYIHRIGRTGRAGKEGTSVVLLTSKEIYNFKKMIESAGKTSVEEININEKELEEYQNSYEEAIKSLGSLLEKKKQKKISNIKTKKKMKMKAAKGKFIKKRISENRQENSK